MKDKIATLKVSQLIEDFSIYPRMSADETNVGYIAQAIRAGVEMPMPIIENKTWRIVDGLHRKRAFRRVHGDDAKIACIARTYPSDRELFIEAGRLNASHGRAMSKQDRAHFIARAEELSIDPEMVASALNMALESLGPLKDTYTATGHDGASVIIKKSIAHMAGQTLNKKQIEAIPKLSGMNQTFHVNELIRLIDAKLLDTENEKLMERLKVLATKLEAVVGVAA